MSISAEQNSSTTRTPQSDDICVSLVVSRQNLNHLTTKGIRGVITLHLDPSDDGTYTLRTTGIARTDGLPNPIGGDPATTTVSREIFRTALLDSDGTLDDQIDKLSEYVENYLDSEIDE